MAKAAMDAVGVSCLSSIAPCRVGCTLAGPDMGADPGAFASDDGAQQECQPCGFWCAYCSYPCACRGWWCI